MELLPKDNRFEFNYKFVELIDMFKITFFLFIYFFGST